MWLHPSSIGKSIQKLPLTAKLELSLNPHPIFAVHKIFSADYFQIEHI